ncbi:ABC transporter permease [Lachnospiraceae bacterium OttesenSCG-928-E19]|nr:ABC transporter permease [Lachnospiraceae bacterium OttesenSCG-928-E19]
MKGLGSIFQKELARIFKDKKMMFSVFILPVAVMIGIMVLVGNLVTNMMDDIEAHTPIVYVQNETVSFNTFLKESDIDADVQSISTSEERQKAEAEILSGDADLLIEFPEDFDDKILNYQDGDEIPQIKTYFNPSEDYSSEAFDVISTQALETYRQMLLTQRVGNLDQIAVFTVNTDNENMIIQDDEKASGKMLGMMLPYFITILLFAGAMGIGTDMIAGEKERGTMASLLMTPIKRSSIALGKVFSLMTLSGLSSIISVVAMVLCMPLMMQTMAEGGESSISFSLDMSQIIMLLVLLIAISFLYSTIIALFSVFAKNTKEASSYVMPVYMLVLVIGLLTMYQSKIPDSRVFFIPIYNTALVLKNILTQEVTMFQYGVSLGTTVLVSVVLIGVIVKAFNSEKVMSA